MRFVTAVFLLPLLTASVSGLSHHHDEQHVMDMTQEQHTDHETQTRMESTIQQEIETQHTQQIQQQVEELTTIQQQLQAEVDAEAKAEAEGEQQQQMWPFDEGLGKVLKERFTSWIEGGKSVDTNALLMKEPTLIRATEQTPKGFQHNLLEAKPYTKFEIDTLTNIHDTWLNLFGWLKIGTGYEFNWARMWEPVTQQYRSYVPAVKSQRCGTCWDFSTSAMISSHMAIKYSIDRPIQWDPETVNPISLSEGELFECTGASGVDDVCNGNWIQNAAARVKATGIAQNVDYQFTGSLTTNSQQCRGNACGPKCPVKPPATNAAPVKNCNYWPQTCPALSDKRRSDNPRFKIDNLVSVTNPSGDPANPTNAWVGSSKNPLQLEQIRNLLRTKGPLGFYFRVESGFTMPGNDVWPNDGAIYTTACTGVGINHAMVIVGYGKTPVTHPKQPNMDYWIVLNSWGNWSTDGFIKIQAGVNLCSAENIAFYPELPAADLAASDPCASQGSEIKKIQCFLSLCDNTILSTSRYCQSKGRKNFCQRVKDSKPAMCPNACPPPPRTISTKVTSILTPKCKAECQMYDRVCRVNFQLDTKTIYQDYIKPLDTRIAEARIGVPIDNIAIAKLDPQPIKKPFNDIYQRQYGNQQTMVASNIANVATQAKTA